MSEIERAGAKAYFIQRAAELRETYDEEFFELVHALALDPDLTRDDFREIGVAFKRTLEEDAERRALGMYNDE